MGSRIDELVVEGYHPIFSCEGSAEQIVVEKLLAANALAFAADDVVDVTRKRKAADIQEEHLSYDYDFPVCIVRLLDSRKERFKLGNLYVDRFPVVSVLTHPEIEILAILKEGKWEKWSRSGKKPSEFCKSDLGFGHQMKSAEFLKGYWDADSLVKAAMEYRRISSIPKGEICLADLLNEKVRIRSLSR